LSKTAGLVVGVSDGLMHKISLLVACIFCVQVIDKQHFMLLLFLLLMICHMVKCSEKPCKIYNLCQVATELLLMTSSWMIGSFIHFL